MKVDKRFLIVGSIWAVMVMLGQNCTRVEFGQVPGSPTQKTAGVPADDGDDADDVTVGDVVPPSDGLPGGNTDIVGGSNPPAPGSGPGSGMPKDPGMPKGPIKLPEVVNNDGDTNPEYEDEIETDYACMKGNKERGVLVCHVPPGNPAARTTKCLPRPALAAHLNHGNGDEHDYLGRCEDTQLADNND